MTHSELIGIWAAAPEVVLDWGHSITHPVVIGDANETNLLQARLIDSQPGPDRKYGVAVLPLHGLIFPRGQLPGGTSAEEFGKQFTQLINDPSVRSILLDINSYGGRVEGIFEISDLIFQSRGKKPVMAIAHFAMDAGAYWIGTAADEVIVSPSSEIGGIGIVAIHDDQSGMLKQAGIKLTLISAGKYKVEGNPWEPLTEEARSHIQESVGIGYDQFIAHVARNRGVAPSVVRDGFGQGRVVSAKKAMQLHVADRIETFDEIIYRLKVKAILNRPSAIRKPY